MLIILKTESKAMTCYDTNTLITDQIVHSDCNTNNKPRAQYVLETIYFVCNENNYF